MAATTLMFSAVQRAADRLAVSERLMVSGELGVVYLFIQLALWDAVLRKLYACAALGCVIAFMVRKTYTSDSWNFENADAVFFLKLSLAFSGAVIGISLFFNALHRDVNVVTLLPIMLGKSLYIISAFVQFGVGRHFFFSRLQFLVGEWPAVVLTAVLFAVAHAPNFPLMGLVLVWFLIALPLSVRLGSMLIPAIMQALFSITLLISVPPEIMCFHVGIGYQKITHRHVPTIEPSKDDVVVVRRFII